MILVALMYVGKVAAKLGIGYLTGSVVMTADGFHNLSDIVEAGLVILAVVFAESSGNGEYPFGRRNLESIAVLVIGVMLIGIAGNLVVVSLGGIERTFFPGMLPFLEDGHSGLLPKTLDGLSEWYWYAAVTGAVSIVLSVLMSSLQIAVGERYAKPVIVGDGRETRSDGIIESVILVSISGEYFFGVPWLEYVLGPVAAVFVARAGWELAKKGWQALLQRSIGADHDAAIRRIMLGYHGVTDVPDVKSFAVGGMIVIIAKVVSRCNAGMNRILKPVMVDAVGAYLAENGFPSYACYIRIEAPPLREFRVAYAVMHYAGKSFLAEDLASADAILVVDVVRGERVRGKVYPIGARSFDAVAFLTSKRVRQFFTWRKLPPDTLAALAAAGVEAMRSPDILVR
jgi:cation diffusion facilitator family transporter